MRNKEDWRPSKFVFRRGKLSGSRDPKEVGVSSRVMADRVAAHYGAHLSAYARGRLVDLGCGKVPLFAVYREYVSDILCVDWSNSLHPNPYLDFECDLNGPLPIGDDSVDTVILSDVLEHLSQPASLWKEMSRILTQGGHVIMNAPFFYPVHEAPFDFYRYTEFALRQMAESSGFRVVVLVSIGGVPEILSDIAAKNIHRIRWLGPWMARTIQEACALLLRTSMGKKLSAKTSKNFPFGYFLVAEKI